MMIALDIWTIGTGRFLISMWWMIIEMKNERFKPGRDEISRSVSVMSVFEYSVWLKHRSLRSLFSTWWKSSWVVSTVGSMISMREKCPRMATDGRELIMDTNARNDGVLFSETIDSVRWPKKCTAIQPLITLRFSLSICIYNDNDFSKCSYSKRLLSEWIIYSSVDWSETMINMSSWAKLLYAIWCRFLFLFQHFAFLWLGLDFLAVWRRSSYWSSWTYSSSYATSICESVSVVLFVGVLFVCSFSLPITDWHVSRMVARSMTICFTCCSIR